MAASRRSFVASSVAALAFSPLSRLAHGDAPVRLKLHHAMSSVSCAHTDFLVPWARNIEAQADGRIHIEIFPSMELGGQPADLFDQARYGAADIVWAMPSKTPGRFPRIETFELPFVASSRALVSSKAAEDFSANLLRDEFREVHPLCLSCADRGILHANRPIQSLPAIKDLRLDVRTRFTAAAVDALGGHPMPMPSGQLSLAVARRVVDAAVIPWHKVPALKLDALLKTHTDFADYALSTTTYVLAMNKAAYAKLPSDLKKIIDDNSGQAAASMAGAMWDLKAKAVADAVRGSGQSIDTLSPEAVAPWRKATEPVIEVWIKDMRARRLDGEKLLAAARTLLVKYASEPEPQPPQVLQPPQLPTPQSPPATAKSTTPAAPAAVTPPTMTAPPAGLNIPL
jgi:TRAP-type transport system periplasmic protein